MSHWNDIHCKETGTVHFHTAEHHCFICDSLLPVTTSPLHDLTAVSNFPHHSTTILFQYVMNIFSISHYFFSLRAPPALA
jgi:hypothetical protein